MLREFFCTLSFAIPCPPPSPPSGCPAHREDILCNGETHAQSQAWDAPSAGGRCCSVVVRSHDLHMTCVMPLWIPWLIFPTFVYSSIHTCLKCRCSQTPSSHTNFTEFSCNYVRTYKRVTLHESHFIILSFITTVLIQSRLFPWFIHNGEIRSKWVLIIRTIQLWLMYDDWALYQNW